MKIAFLENLLSIRGSTVALHDYAHYNETILGNTSAIITRPLRAVEATAQDACAIVYDKFEARFPVFYYSEKSDIQAIIDKEKIDVLYVIKYGLLDGLEDFHRVKTLIHCVFDARQAHGNIFTVISPWLNLAFSTNFPVLPHIVSLPDIADDLRNELGIPPDAIVFGRHGGYNEFDHPVPQHVIAHIASQHNNTYFVFMNTRPFLEPCPPRVIFLDKSTDPVYKTKFINTCDAMIYGRSRGETFGLAIGEFSIRNKPVFAPLHAPEMMHRLILQDRAYWYTDETNLLEQMAGFDPRIARDQSWNMHQDFSPPNVMKIFQALLDKETFSDSRDK